jgi:hypothetical protein
VKGRSLIEIPVGKGLPTRELEIISALRTMKLKVLVEVGCLEGIFASEWYQSLESCLESCLCAAGERREGEKETL